MKEDCLFDLTEEFLSDDGWEQSELSKKVWFWPSCRKPKYKIIDYRNDGEEERFGKDIMGNIIIGPVSFYTSYKTSDDEEGEIKFYTVWTPLRDVDTRREFVKLIEALEYVDRGFKYSMTPRETTMLVANVLKLNETVGLKIETLKDVIQKSSEYLEFICKDE